MTLEKVLSCAAGLQAAAMSDSNGLVLETNGEVEAESLCALIAMCRPALERAADQLSLGSVMEWSFTYHTGSVFVRNLGDGVTLTVTGAATKNPEITMGKLALAMGDKR